MNDEQRLLALSLAVILVTATFTPFLTLPVGTATAANTGSCTTIDSATTITSSGCYVVTSDLTGTSDGAYISVEADDVTIKGQGNKLEAGSILTETSSVTETVTSSGDTFVDTNRVAVYVDGSSGTVSNVTVQNLTISNYSVAVYGDETSGLTVSNVAASGLGSSGVGVRLNGSSGATIRDSTLGGTLQLFDGTVDTLVENVSILAAPGRGIYVRNADETTIRRTTVEDISAPSQADPGHGVVLEDAIGTTLDTVVVDGTDNRGLFLSGAVDTSVKNTTIRRVQKDGITVFDGGNATVTGTYISATSDGIVVSNSSNFTVADSTVFGRISGLYLDTSPGSVVRNVSVGGRTTGISIRSGTSDTLVTNSTVAGDGSLVEGPGIYVVSTYLPTNNVTIRNNTIARLGPVGISVRNATNATVAENDIVNVTAGPNAPDSTGNGIEIAAGSTGGTVRGNTILETSGTGVVVAADDTLVADTVVFETGDSGVATDSASNVTFRDLTISRTNDTAISLESSGNVTVEKSTVLWSGTVTTGPNETTTNGTTTPKGFVFVNQTSGSLNALTSNGTLIDYKVSDVKTIGPRAFFDEDERREVPYVDGRGNLKIVDSTGETKILVETGTLGTNPRASKSKLAVGDWDHDGATDVFFANGNGDLFRVDWDERNAPDRITTDKSVQFVVASVDITGDGLREILYVDTNSALRYVNETGTDTKISVDSTWGANDQVGFGEPALLNGTFVSPRVSGSQTTELQLYDGTVQSLQSGLSVTKTAPTAVDLSGDGVPEFLYVSGDGRSIRAVRANGESNTVFGPDGTAIDPVESIGLASRVESSVASERVTGEGVDFFVDRNGRTAQRVENLTIGGVGTISFTAQNVSVDAESSLPAAPNGTQKLTGTGVRVDEAAGDSHGFLLTVSYTDGDVGNGDETTARIARFDPTSDADGDWVFEQSTVQTAQNRVTATVGPTEGVVAAFLNETDGESTDRTPPTVTNVSITSGAATTVTISVVTDERLDTLRVDVDTRSGNLTTLTRNDFNVATTETGNYSYTATTNTTAGATVTATLSNASDAARNDGSSGETVNTTTEPTGETLTVDPDGDTQFQSIQSAIDAASAGDTVRVRPGTYIEQLAIQTNVTVVFAEGAILNGFTLGDSARAITFGPDTNATVVGATIQGYGAGVDARETTGNWSVKSTRFLVTGTAVDARESTGDWTVANTTVVRTDRSGLTTRGADGEWTVSNTTIRRTGGHGVDAEATTGDWRLQNSSLNGTRLAGVHAEDATGAWTIEQTSVVQSGTVGVAATETTGNWTVDDSTILEADRAGVAATSATGNWTVTDTAVGFVRLDGIVADDTSGAWSLQNVTVTGVGDDGVQARSATGRWTITGGTVRSVGESAIDAENTSARWTVSGVVISGAQADGLYAPNASGDWTLRDSRISATSDGVAAYDTGGNWTITNLTITEVRDDGIDASATSGDWTARNVTVSKTGENGIEASRTTGRWTITNATVANTSGTAVGTVGSSGAWTIRNTILRSAGFDGLDADRTTGDWTLSKVTVKNASRIGVSAHNTTGDWTITESIVSNSSADGIVAFDAAGNWLLTESVIAGNGRTGLVARGTDTGNASNNYWGASDGPGGSYVGSGDTIAGTVTLGKIYTDRTRTRTAAAPGERTTDGKLVVAADGSGDTTSIQTAIDRANPGDTIRVESGTYRERIRVGVDVTITGSNATLNGSTLPDGAVGLWIPSGDSVAPEVDSLRLSGYQFGIYAPGTAGAWTLRNTTVTDMLVGIYAPVSTGDWVVTNGTLLNTEFSGLSFPQSTGAPTIRDTLVVDAGDAVLAASTDGDWTVDNLTAIGVDTAIDARESSGNWAVQNSRFEVIDTDGEDVASGTAVYAANTTGAWTVTNTTLTDAPVTEIDATGASPAGDATGNWWGSPDGATADDCRGNVACGAPLDDPTHTVVVDSVTVDETLTVGSDESVSIVVKNTDVRTRTARVTVTVGDSVVVNRSVTLAEKSRQTITATVPTNQIGAGTATVTARTRTDGTTETVRTETRLVQPSSLEILTATVPPVATADQQVTVPAVIRNTGGRVANQTVELRIDTDGDGTLESDEVVNSTQVSILPRRVSTVSLGFDTSQISGGSYAVGIVTANTSASETLSVEAAAPELTVSARSLSLGQFDLGASESRTITLENTGGSALNVSDISFVGRDASAFSVGTSTPVVIQPGESQQLTVTVAPGADAAGPLRATLQITSSDPTSPLTTVSLSANATGPAASTNRDTLRFFSQAVNSTNNKTFLLDNRGNNPLSVSDVSITGPDASAFEIVAEPSAVSPSGTREITVSFTPDRGGDKQATLEIETDDPNDGTITIDLSGSGREPDVSVTPASVSFGTVGSESVRTKTVKIRNTGGAPLDFDRIGLNGSAAISVVSGSGSDTLVPGETRRVTIQFAPATAGGASATLSVLTDDPDAAEATTTVSISGVGQVPDVSVGTASTQFGQVGLGSSSLTAITVTNDGNETLVLTNASLGGSDAGAFAVVTGDGIRVPPGKSRTVSVAFAPETTGSASATLSLETNDPDEGTRTVSLSGTGADADIGADTASISFGATDVGTTETRTVTITNDGAASTTISTVAFTDSSATALSIVSGGGAVTLDSGESQQVIIQFAPTSEGERSGLLQAINDTGVIVTNVSVGGVGAVPNVTLNTTSVSYDDTRVGGQETKLVRVKNDGNAQLNLTDVSVTGQNTSSFRVLSAPATVQAGAVEFVRIAFEPATAGGSAARSKAANVTLTTNDPAATTANVTLSGTAETVQASVSPGNLTFGKIAVGGTATQTITVSNDKNASANLTITRSAIVGPDAGAYEIVSGSPPFTLKPGESATVTVEISPQNPGRKFGRLRLFTTDPATSQLDVFLSNSQTVIDVDTSSGNGTSGPGATVTVRNAPNNTTLPANVSTGETLESDVGIQNLNVTTKQTGNFSVNFTQADQPPAKNAPNFSAPNQTNVSPVKYVRVNKTISDSQIANATFKLRVSKVQVEQSGTEPSEISLYRFVDGSWVELNGTLVGETTTHYIYSVETPGFSDFAAGAKKPQFNVTNAEIPPGDVRVTAIVVGDAVDILVQITNEKGAADGTFTTKLLLDGTVVDTKDVTIAAGGTRQVRFVREFTSTGTFSVLVNNATAGSVEVNEPKSSSSDSGSSDDGIETQPLQIDETAISSTTIEPGGEVTFSLDVSNPDDQPQVFSAPLKINGVTVENRRISVRAGETVTVTYTRTFRRTGTYDVSIGDTNLGRVTVTESADDTATATDEPAATETATPTETPVETPEPTDTPAGTADGTPTDTASGTPEDSTDTPAGTAGTAVGTATGTDTPAGPADVSVTKVFVDTRSVGVGDQVTITAIVTNEGGSEGTVSVPLVVNGVTVASQDVTVSAGTSVRLTFERRFQSAGEFQIGVGDRAAGEIVVSAQTGSGPGSGSATATATETSTGFAPGFDPASVIAALLALALLARRRN